VRFDVEGNRPGGSGEYVVHLRPLRTGERLRAHAVVRVHRRQEGERPWALIRELDVPYVRGRSVGNDLPAGGGEP
jgi:hypothetical protein